MVVFDGGIDYITGYVHQLDLFKQSGIYKRYSFTNTRRAGKHERN